MVTEQLLQQLDEPRAASKVLCGLTALHWALQKGQNKPTAAQSLPEAVVLKLQTALAAPAAIPGPAGQTRLTSWLSQPFQDAIKLCA